MGKKLLFIGAGASYGARESFCQKPPLANKLLPFMKQSLSDYAERGWDLDCRTKMCDPNYDNLREFYDFHMKTGTPYEKAIECLLNGKSSHGLLQDCNKFLVQIFSGCHVSAFAEKKDLYDNLVEKIGFDEEWNIISLNYEVLFEQALIRAGKHFRYLGVERNTRQSICEETACMIKPHGSVNWFSSKDESGPTPELANERKRSTTNIASSESGVNVVTRDSNVLLLGLKIPRL